MAHQPVNPHPTQSDNGAPAPLTLEQVLHILSVVVPHMPKESQISFLAIVFGITSNLPPHEPLTILTGPLRMPFPPDALRGVVQAKAIQHLRETDSAFEAKQRAAEKASKMSKGVTKRYEKTQNLKVVEERARRAVVYPGNAYTTPYGVPWSNGGVPVPGIYQATETTSDSTAYFHHWDSKNPSSSVHRYSQAEAHVPLSALRFGP